MNPQSSLEVVRLAGELDVSRREEVVAALERAAAAPAVLIDLSDVPYADSTVLAELLRFHGTAEANGRRVAVLITSPQVSRILEYAGVPATFPVYTDRGAALTHLAGTKAE
ncbi:MAG TPA: STAS domain-containing protein [Candidatus Elarobacter sp.]|jgi:anti-sigma B factor antagonist|nr:STAS domain-containing protein [Candidatus Elarobacter sp.]